MWSKGEFKLIPRGAASFHPRQIIKENEEIAVKERGETAAHGIKELPGPRRSPLAQGIHTAQEEDPLIENPGKRGIHELCIKAGFPGNVNETQGQAKGDDRGRKELVKGQEEAACKAVKALRQALSNGFLGLSCQESLRVYGEHEGTIEPGEDRGELVDRGTVRRNTLKPEPEYRDEDAKGIMRGDAFEGTATGAGVAAVEGLYGPHKGLPRDDLRQIAGGQGFEGRGVLHAVRDGVK